MKRDRTGSGENDMAGIGSERRWELVEDAYHKKSRYVLYPNGMIIGHVDGTPYETSAPWYAAIDGQNGRKPIGTFTTEGLAKRAVEAASVEATSRRRK
jgi:hypothetical protein